MKKEYKILVGIIIIIISFFIIVFIFQNKKTDKQLPGTNINNIEQSDNENIIGDTLSFPDMDPSPDLDKNNNIEQNVISEEDNIATIEQDKFNVIKLEGGGSYIDIIEQDISEKDYLLDDYFILDNIISTTDIMMSTIDKDYVLTQEDIDNGITEHYSDKNTTFFNTGNKIYSLQELLDKGYIIDKSKQYNIDRGPLLKKKYIELGIKKSFFLTNESSILYGNLKKNIFNKKKTNKTTLNITSDLNYIYLNALGDIYKILIYDSKNKVAYDTELIIKKGTNIKISKLYLLSSLYGLEIPNEVELSIASIMYQTEKDIYFREEIDNNETYTNSPNPNKPKDSNPKIITTKNKDGLIEIDNYGIINIDNITKLKIKNK